MPKAQADIRSLARAHTELAINTLVGVARSKGAPPAARVAASGILLDRGWGKAPVQLTGEDGGPIRVIIRQIVDIATESDTPLIEHEPVEE